MAVALPFVTEVWQVYLLIFLLQWASAAFTPTFQATVPDVLPDESRYTRALSLSRLAGRLMTFWGAWMMAHILLAGLAPAGLALARRVWPEPQKLRRAAFIGPPRLRCCPQCWPNTVPPSSRPLPSPPMTPSPR
ncbi:hypothetical protein SAMN05444722_2049 [Rhodovulum sp. ES.010]|nr:hypothetical protein SAMN05444722_2049 [Rhodovulum sp. ES.010]